MKREKTEWLVCMLVASIALVYSIWVVPYIPTMDGPQHVLSVHIENHYSDPGSSYPEFYRILPQYAGKGFALVFAPLESLLPWRVALRITLSLVTVAFAWGFALVALAIGPRRYPTAMLGFPIALSWPLYMGFFPFTVGTTLGLYTLAYVLHRPPTTNRRRVLLSVMLLAQAVCHVFTAVLTGAIVMGLAAMLAPKGERLRPIARTALIGAPAAMIMGLTLQSSATPSELQPAEWALAERVSEISRWFVPGPGIRGWLVIGLVIAAVIGTRARARAGRATPTEQAFAWLAAAFFVLTLLTPLHISGWSCFAPRFVIFTMVLGLVIVRPPDIASPRMARALLPAVTVVCVLSSLASANLHRQLAKGCGDTLAGLDVPLHFEGPRLPMILDWSCATPASPLEGPVPRASFAYNTPLLYLVEHGGIGTKMFNGLPSIHAIAFSGTRRPPRPDPRAVMIAQSKWAETDLKLRAAAMTELAADGMPFEGIHVVGGRPADFAVFTERGYVTEFQNASVFVGRFEGCPAELLLSSDALEGSPVFYEYGLVSPQSLSEEPRVVMRRRIAEHMPPRDGSIHVPIAGRPCGEIWIRVVWDVDTSSTYTPGDRTCGNAGALGRVTATLNREHAAIPCSARAPEQ